MALAQKLILTPSILAFYSRKENRAWPTPQVLLDAVLQEFGMSIKSPAPVVNRLLDRLPRKDRNRMLSRCELVDLEFGAILCEPDQLFEHAYFPLTSFISQVEISNGHAPLEINLIGNEGMLGVTLMLGVDGAPLRAVVQGTGSALRMHRLPLRNAIQDSPALLDILQRYLYVMVSQLSQTTACTHFHEIEARLARWLLLTHDRAHADHFHLTHQLLANMLGVQRSAVTIAAGALQKRKLINYTRGEINIIDRDGLEAATCECYAAVIDDYARQFSS